MQAAAISYKGRLGGMRRQTWWRELDLFRIIFYRVSHVKPVVPSRSGGHRGERAVEMRLNTKLDGDCRESTDRSKVDPRR